MDEIFITITGSLIAVISYFLKIVHSDLRKNIAETNSVKSKLELVQQESFGKIDKLASITEIQISQLTAQISKLTANIDHLTTMLYNDKR